MKFGMQTRILISRNVKLQMQDGDECHVKNRGSAIGISQHHIKAKFGERKQNHTQTQVT